MIKLEGVNKYFYKNKKNEIHVINNTSLELEDTGLVALLGNSGSGKTTLLNAIGGLDKVDKGKIFIDNQKITRRNYRKIDKIRNINIGYIFQDYKLIDNMTVYENIALVLKMIGIKDKQEIKKRIDYVLETLNIYRYRNRMAGMLSGGERQRVAIARAIVKNPKIIIADEPTGNLDSKNSLEIMNIIKSISKDILVILVTHEEELANFYASRIIKVQDGKVIKDYINKHDNNLDYKIDNRFYLKDFKEHEVLEKDNIKIDLYAENKEEIDIKVIIKNGNIYIKNKNKQKIEPIEEDSNIELINEHYKQIDKKIYQEYKFDFDKIVNKKIKIRYSSIFNPITLITNSFKRIFNYSILKKILLIGFLISAMFIVYAVSSIFGVLNVEDKDFINTNKEYLNINIANIDVNKFLEYEKLEDIEYILPGDSKIQLKINYNYWYQTNKAQDTLSGSLSSIDMLTENDLYCGNMPKSENEIVIDKLVFENMLKNSYYISSAKQVGIKEAEDLLEKQVEINKYMDNLKIVGIVDKGSPSIYTSENLFINILSNTSKEDYDTYDIISLNDEETTNVIFDYVLLKDKIKLEKGKFPENDYETIVNISEKENMPLNKKIDVKVNDIKLTVVGYYSCKEDINEYLVNNNTIKYKLVKESSNLTVYSRNKEKTISMFKKLNMNIKDAYTYDRAKFIEKRKEYVSSSLLVSGIILGISLIEVWLMMRSSFLSKIKEIGIYRAIGVKKKDIYKIFIGEIAAITTIASIPGVLIMSYIISVLATMEYLESFFIINIGVILISIIMLFVFNIAVGLIPVYSVLRKTPAQILSRNDVE